ncbi:MAG TPA: glycosyltransferase [Gemmatimonadaceae bacterium]|nr:glycosyltransferase [Gemmatimonadaceae bacterium]
MRIVITNDPIIPVPPSGYGGIERIVDFVVRGLVAHGHEVTLLAHPSSQTPATLVPYGVPPHTGARARATELWQVASHLVRHRHRYDIIHSFGRLAALVPVLPMRGIPKIQSYQRPVPWRSVRIAARIAGDSVRFTGCSTSLWEHGRPGASRWRTVFNGAPMAPYTPVLRVPDDAPLIFLGRLDPIKGVHHAIAIAKGAGRRLVIAGPRQSNDRGYFEREIAPHLSSDVTYIGELDDRGKNALLGTGAAFLMPIEWDEPFGIVMAEALACGTPVIGFRRGSVPEVVRDGRNGYVCDTVADAVARVACLSAIDRAAVRADFEARFSDRALVAAYEALYAEMVA